MSFWKKHTLRLSAVLGSATLLLGCATYVHPGTTLYWSGKHINEYLASEGLTPTTEKMCKDNDKPFIIYGFAKPSSQIVDREVGRSYNSYGGTTIYVKKERQYTGKYLWSYIFTDLDGKITSHRSDTWFGDIDKEFSCQDLDGVLNDDNKLTSHFGRQSLWMSIAGSPDNKKMMWESSKAHTSQKDAEEDALKQCRDEGNTGCNAVISYSNVCLSSGIGMRNGSYFDVLGFGLNKKYANQDVIEQCEAKGGSNCRTVVEGLCATACDMLTDKSCLLQPPQILYPNR
ncbi:DUF4189 domain-containing protein [Aggregatibacter kilianii]|uniref:DUF4189 domain-containing protein n=1 Tax=Aggregatibacter kilianii TaxID=2025884 RepID=UPI000D650490|nr:DUF4189 domain-containing protein [Aggregatibacter kilianii]